MRRMIWVVVAILIAAVLLVRYSGFSDFFSDRPHYDVFGAHDAVWALGWEDSSASFVLATYPDGTSQSWSLEEVAPGAPAETLFSNAFVDQTGMPWLINFHHEPGPGPGMTRTFEAVSTFDGEQWRGWTRDETGCPMLFQMVPGPENTVWVQGEDCIAYTNGTDPWQKVTTDGEFPSGEIAWLEFGPDGTLWVAGKWPGGWIARWDGIWAIWNAELPEGNPIDMVFETDGSAWVSFAGGLAHFDRDSWTTWQLNTPQLPMDRVGRLFLDSGGALWMQRAGSWAFQSHDVSRLQDGKWSHWSDQDGLPVGSNLDRSYGPLNRPTELPFWELPDHSIAVRVMEVCRSSGWSGDDHCVGGGWARFDGQSWTEIDPPVLGYLANDGTVWWSEEGRLVTSDPEEALVMPPLGVPSGVTLPSMAD